jgi:predicted amidohydrolase
MRDLKVGIVQFSPFYKKTEQNLTKILQLIQEGARQGAKILCLPEMCLSGYLFPGPQEARQVAIRAKDSTEIRRIKSLAKDLAITLAFGFLEEDGEWLFNSQMLVGPGGETLALYRKRHLFAPDEWWAQPGPGPFLSVPTAWGKLGLGICMDLNYRDFVEFHIAQETDIVLFSTNWIDQGFLVQPYWFSRWEGSRGLS